MHGFDRIIRIRLYGSDETRNALRSLLRFLRKFPDLVSNNGKAASLTACAGCLDSSIQRKQICLFRNAGNSLHNLADFLGTLSELIHRGGRGINDTFHADNLIDGALDGLAAGGCLLACGIRVLRHQTGSFVQTSYRSKRMIDGFHRVAHLLLLLHNRAGRIGSCLRDLLGGLRGLMGTGCKLLR